MPGELRATDLDRELVLAFTDTYGAGEAQLDGPMQRFWLSVRGVGWPGTLGGRAAATTCLPSGVCSHIESLRHTALLHTGTLYTLCRDASDPKWKAQNISHACDLGTQCCGYLGSPGRAGKLPDTWCVPGLACVSTVLRAAGTRLSCAHLLLLPVGASTMQVLSILGLPVSTPPCCCLPPFEPAACGPVRQ